MSPSTRRLRIAAADDDRDTRQFFEMVLPHLGHEIVAVVSSGRELIECCRVTQPDLVITDIKMPDMDGIDAASEINRVRAVPFILVSAFQDAELLGRAGAEYVMAYLTKPVKPTDLAAALALAWTRFTQLQTARREAAELRQALEERKLVERAKGIVIRRMGLDEQEAFRRMRKLSSDRNLKLIQVARTVLAAEAVFMDLEAAASTTARGISGVPQTPFASRKRTSIPENGSGRSGVSDETLHDDSVLPAGEAFDAAGDNDGVGAHDPNGAGDVLRRQPAGQNERHTRSEVDK
jgi:response regulator NasT